MSIAINEINLSLFKGFKKTNIQFTPELNLLVGTNNSGKSSILQAIYLAFDFLRLTGGISEYDKKRAIKDAKLRGSTVRNITLPFHDESYISEGLKRRANRETSTKIEVTINNKITFMETLTFPGGNLLVFTSDTHQRAGSETFRKKINRLVKQEKNFPLYIPSFAGVASKEEIKKSEVIKYYISSGKASEVLRNQLENISQKKREFLNKYLKNGFGAEIINNDTKEIYLSSLYKEEGYNNLDISSGGSGFQQILQILVYIVSSDADIILIDEPDAHLHCKLQHILYDIFLALVKDGKQIIIATHSQVFIKKAISNNDNLILVSKKRESQKNFLEYEQGFRKLYTMGLFDEYDIEQKNYANIICLEDAIDGNGFGIMKEFLKKIGVKEPSCKFLPSGEVGNNVLSYIEGKTNIEGLKISAIEFKDSDSLDQRFVSILEKNRTNKKVKLYYTKVHEVENYLINTKILSNFLKEKVQKISSQSIEKILTKLVNDRKNRDKLLDLLRTSLEEQYKRVYREPGIRIEYGKISQLVQKE